MTPDQRAYLYKAKQIRDEATRMSDWLRGVSENINDQIWWEDFKLKKLTPQEPTPDDR